MGNKKITYEKPLCLENDTGVDMYPQYIDENIIPKMLQVIEDSRLSFRDARLIPEILKHAITIKEEAFLQSTRFTDFHSEEHLLDAGRERLW